jgi:hypothetical protein
MRSLDRFKKRRALQSYLRAEDANALPAEQIVAALGLTLTVQGKHVELANGMRGTYKDGTRLVWCRKDGSGIGDNCELTMLLAGVDFRQALKLLLGYAAAHPVDYMPAPTAPKVLRIPGTAYEAQQNGREYLRSRGIADTALATAEACEMVRYVHGAVLFVGYDNQPKGDAIARTPRSATRRGYLESDSTPKRDLFGSDKSWPAILPGSPAHVWVVEGGVDGLALHTLYPDDPPTVIVSGGAGCKAWLEQQHIIAMFERAEQITVATEHEKNAEVQARIDAQHAAQVRSIKRYCADVVTWSPPLGVKDIAETLLAETRDSGTSN